MITREEIKCAFELHDLEEIFRWVDFKGEHVTVYIIELKCRRCRVIRFKKIRERKTA